MRIYFDVCCLGRPFDDQNQDRIHLESEAVITILSHIERGDWKWIGSEVIYYEVDQIPDAEQKKRILQLISESNECIRIDEQKIQRAKRLETFGFKALDALHLACAEAARVDIVLTTDDRLRRNAERHKNHLHVKVANPLRWLEEELR